jgi:hypothetical protein
MNNEDSIFFWNPLGWLAEGKKMPRHSKLLRERFAAWVKAKYKTDDALKAAWGELRGGDSVSAGELAIMSPWHLPAKDPARRSLGRRNARATTSNSSPRCSVSISPAVRKRSAAPGSKV